MTSYHVHGFKRDDHGVNVSVIVDGDISDDKFEIAEAIAGPDYCLHASENISPTVSVPDAAKNRLFLSEEELFAAVPELKPRRRAARRAVR